MDNLEFDLIASEIAEEIKVDKDGKATFSIAAAGRLHGISRSTLSDAFLRGFNSAGISRSKLAQKLMQLGFEPAEFGRKGIPDIAMGIISLYYGFEATNQTDEARFLVYYFQAKQWREWAREKKGWSREISQEYFNERMNLYIRSQTPDTPTRWEERFPIEFWENLDRLYQLKRGDQGCAPIISNYIYKKFPEAVRSRLNEINPLLDNGLRARKIHQHLTSELLSSLIKIIHDVIVVMRVSSTQEQFKELVKRIPKIEIPQEVIAGLLEEELEEED